MNLARPYARKATKSAGIIVTRDRPRRPEDPMLLLLQLDSDETMDLVWATLGLARLFLYPRKRPAGEGFFPVLYDWDCL